MSTHTLKKACLFGGALLAAGLSSPALASEFVIGESTHNHGIDVGPIVSAYAGNGSFTLDTRVGLPFGPTSIESSFSTGTVASVHLGPDAIRAKVEKQVDSFGYFAFNTYFLVTEDTDVTIAWDASTEVPWIDRKFRVWQSMGATLFEYDVNNGPHTGEVTVHLQAGQLYYVDALYRSVWDNGNGSFSITFPQDSCAADLNGDGQLDFFDVSSFLSAYNAMDLSVDLNGDGELNFFDVSAFLTSYNAGCP